MVRTDDNHPLEALAEEVFELNKLSWTARAQARRQPELYISDYEFLALDVLAKQGPMTVGELQKHVGVMPAQMSRVIRSLENKPDGPMITCAINARDKRKVDVTLTEAGRGAVGGYRTSKLATITETLTCLGPGDRDEFIRILRLIRSHLARNETPA